MFYHIFNDIAYASTIAKGSFSRISKEHRSLSTTCLDSWLQSSGKCYRAEDDFSRSMTLSLCPKAGSAMPVLFHSDICLIFQKLGSHPSRRGDFSISPGNSLTLLRSCLGNISQYLTQSFFLLFHPPQAGGINYSSLQQLWKLLEDTKSIMSLSFSRLSSPIFSAFVL